MKLCIVAHFAFGAITGGSVGHVGGVERQTSLMAKWFVAKGHDVSILTWDEGQPEVSYVEGVRIIKMCRLSDGLPGLRFFYPRWTSLNKAMGVADADIYYQNCGEYVTGQVALWCRRNKRCFVYSTASDKDCDASLPQMRKFRERILYRYGLFNADTIITQTKKQQQMLHSGFGVDSTVLPMPCHGPESSNFIEPVFHGNEPFQVGWAARITNEKRLELLVEVARTLPEVVFHVGGVPPTPVFQQYARPILEAASSLPNIILYGGIKREDMGTFFGKLHLFCCTSAYEGFPNTFLEAWSHGLPIVSTFDPDNLIAEYGIGKVATDVETLVAGIRFFISDPKEWEVASVRARNYYLQNHTVDDVMSRFESVFIETQARKVS